MDVFILAAHLLFVQAVHSLNVSISGQAYIEPGVPYNISCTVDEYKDNRRTTFAAKLSETNREETIVWYYKSYGCFQWRDGKAIDCRNASCACDDNGLTTHWTYNTPSNLTTDVEFTCTSQNNKSLNIQSDSFSPAIPHGPGSTLTFNSSGDFITKKLGEHFSVACIASCKPLCQFQWTKLTSVVSNGTLLHIPKLSKDDNGTYVCKAVNGYGTAGMKELQLKINYSPESVTLLPPNTKYTVTEGDNVSPIKCMADCEPMCNYMWSGPNVPVDTSNVLTLLNIQKTGKGYFYCTASNDEGSSNSSYVNMNVQFGPGSSIKFDPSAISITKNKGENLGPISCAATCNPPCQYTWTKPDKTTINGFQLNVSTLSLADHGQFICTASNGINGSQKQILDVTVNYGPESVTLLPPATQYTVTEGNTIQSIECKADCRPACKLLWSGPNVPTETSNTLILQKINKNQRGDYNCTASNDVGSLQSPNVYLNVQFGPGSSLTFDPSNSSVTKRKGDTLGPIECLASCNPPCQYNWTKTDNVIINNGKLTIPSLSIEDHGLFICTSSNGIGYSQNKNLNVTVNYGPEALILSPKTKNYTVTFGHTLPPIYCSTNCRPDCIYLWSGPHVPYGTNNVLSLQNVQKNQSGDFFCTASNEVGIERSHSINVNVQYEPFVKELLVNGTDFTVRENTTVLLSCSFEGNPAPRNTWERNNILLGEAEEINGRSIYTIQLAQCDDSANYSCVANNSLGMSSAQESLFVTCSPRLNVRVEQPLTKIGLPKGADLNLTIHLISYPAPVSTGWFFKSNERNETHMVSNVVTYELFKHVTILIKRNLTQNDFGDYILKVNNTLGSVIQTYHVVPQGPPDPTTLLNVTCSEQTALLYWKTAFNGGETQYFSIIVHKNDKELYIHDTGIDDEDDKIHKFISIKLSAGKYNFKIYGQNSYGNQNSTNEMNCEVKENYDNDSDLFIGAAAGGVTASVMVILVVIVLVVFIKKRRNVKGDDGRRNLTTEEKDDDEGLKANPLYISSGEASSDSSPLYSVVNKTMKPDVTNKTEVLDKGPVYSEVIKSDAKGKRKTNKRDLGKPGNRGKDFEMGTVYENSKNLTKNNDNDDVYMNEVNNTTEEKPCRPRKNKDGLIYADLDLAVCKGGNKFIIRGLENRNNYAIIDLTKTAEPLPSDEDEEE